MRKFLFIIFSIMLFSKEVIYDTPGNYYTVDVEYANMQNWQLQEWNQIQQNQIDDLLGRVNDLTRNYKVLRYELYTLNKYTADSSAGEIALSTIDFGDVEPGHFSVGFGFGFTEPINGIQGAAGAFGFKYNFGDIKDVQVNGIAKGWSSGAHSGGGFGFTLDF